ncbi:nucleoredoxin-like protein 1, partial [Myiozetetes cayanensis]|uniref:nucleoredoxin-like protein 1 n=1 Tax=Myiozetetes cayanensis TaxID=478635 RepID=UPI00215EB058
RELELRFAVSEVPAVVVLKPSGDVLVANAVEEIQRMGPSCFQNWWEAAEILDRNFRLAEDFDRSARRSFTHPLRRLKYKLDKEQEQEQDRDRDRDREEGEEEP